MRALCWAQLASFFLHGSQAKGECHVAMLDAWRKSDTIAAGPMPQPARGPEPGTARRLSALAALATARSSNSLMLWVTTCRVHPAGYAPLAWVRGVSEGQGAGEG
ncbi:hypothetical protein GCM10028864_25660 [Microlunatus parietis]